MMPEKFNPKYHSESDFLEQIAILKIVSFKDDHVFLQREFIQAGHAYSVGLDPDSPGSDSNMSWEIMDDFIVRKNAAGFFHTHPPEADYWSDQDINTQHGLARANGKKILWHGVQAVGYKQSLFACCWMINGSVFRHSYEPIDDNISDDIIRLPFPPNIVWHGTYYAL